MLYLTTRSMSSRYAAELALSEDRAPDGGFYVPEQLPRFSVHEIRALAASTFSENVARIINLFFDTNLDRWSLEFAIGRYPVQIHTIGSRELVAETWHNPMWKFERLVRGVEKAIRQSDHVSAVPADWLMIATRIAVLFGIFEELVGEGRLDPQEPIDVAFPSGDFSGPVAAWYARQMGLPISTILCCCNDNNGPWKLLHKGEIRMDAAPIKTSTPACDVTVPADLERLISLNLGVGAANEFAGLAEQGGTFYVEAEQLKKLRDCMYVPVTGKRRLESAVKSMYNSCGYLADPYTALCYSGMLDYRSVTGESRMVLICSEESPVHSGALLGKILGISARELKERMDKR